MTLKECPSYEDCLFWYSTHGLDKDFFRCDGCSSYKCYELGFMKGVEEAIKKINEPPEFMLRPMSATDSEKGLEEYYNNCLRKLKGGRQ